MRIATLFAISALAAQSACAENIIPLDTSGPRPTAQLTIGADPPVTVIFDSGAGGSVLSREIGARHRLPNQGAIHVSSPGAKRALPAYFTTLPAARLGGIDITGARAVVADLGVPLPGVSGVMSPNLFMGSLVRFELAKSRVVVTPRSQPPAGEAHPYAGAHPLPSIKIDVAGVQLSAHLDTGSGRGFSLPLEIADKIPLKAPLMPAESVKMAGGERKAFVSRVDGKVRIGPITLVDPPVTFIERFEYANVGFSILKDWTLVLDPERQQSWIVAP